MLLRLKATSEGRELLSGMSEAASAFGRPIVLGLADFPGSETVVVEGVERIVGAPDGVSASRLGTVDVNRAFLRFKDPDQAMDGAVGTAAHELSHVRLFVRVMRRTPRYACVFRYDLSDEIGAWLKGLAVAVQSGGGRLSADAVNAWRLSDDPEASWEELKLWGASYAVKLDLREMADPVKAYEGRLRSLERSLSEAAEALRLVHALLADIDHFEKFHGLAERLRSLRADAEAEAEIQPRCMEDARDSISAVRYRLEELRSEKGPAMIEAFRQASADPGYGGWIVKRNAEALRALREALSKAERPPEPVYPPGQLTKEEFDALVKQDKDARPDRGKGLLKSSGRTPAPRLRRGLFGRLFFDGPRPGGVDTPRGPGFRNPGEPGRGAEDQDRDRGAGLPRAR
jgi:hypothetical protein